jgi:L-malate glycosyltransferase
MGRIRVAYVLDHFDTAAAGTERQFLLLLQGLDRNRFEPTVFLLHRQGPVLSDIPDTRVEMLGITRIARAGTLSAVARFARRLRKERYALAHLWFNDTSLILPWPLRIAGLPVVVSRRDLGFWYTPAKLRALRLQGFAVSAVIANSNAVRERVCAAEGIRRDRVHVIYNGVEPPADQPVEPASARRAIGVSEDSTLLVVVANLKPLKRVDDVIRALPMIAASHPKLQLMVVGADSLGRQSGSHVAELRALAMDLGVDSAVTFVGAQPNVHTYVAAADVCLLCSESEGLSNAVIEYMLAGKPVVATKVGGNPELIASPQCGQLVDVGAPEQIAEAVRRYVESPKLREAHGEAGRRSATLRFGLPSMLHAHERLYCRMASRGFRPGT